MYCVKCGQQLPNEAQFCSNCGTKTVRPTLTDEISAKASDFVMNEDISMSSGDLNNDRVAQDAVLFGDFSSELRHQTTVVPPQPPKRTIPEYKFTRAQSKRDPNIWRVRRDDDLLGLHEYRLENMQYQLISDWFDDIYYDDNDYYVIRKGRSRGLIHKLSFATVLWDNLCGYGSNGRIHSIYGYWGVCKNGKWAIISTHNSEIKHLTEYSFDKCSAYEKDTIQLQQNDKYGCLLFNEDSGTIRHFIPCVLNQLGASSIHNKELGRILNVNYNSQTLYLSRKGIIYKLQSKTEVVQEIWEESTIAERLLSVMCFPWTILYVMLHFILPGDSIEETKAWKYIDNIAQNKL